MKYALFILFFLTACTEVQVLTPNPRIEPPELRGDAGFKFEGSIVPTHMFRATNEGDVRPPNLENPISYGGEGLTPGLNYALPVPVEFGLESSIVSLSLAGVVRWQILGSGTRTAEEGNVPLAVYVRAGTSQGDQSGEQAQTFGPGGYPWKGTVTNNYVHAGISTGYRSSKQVLFYGGIAVGQYWARAEVDQNSNASDSGGVYKETYAGFGDTAGGGALFSWRNVQLFIDGEFTHVQYTKAGSFDSPFVHGGIYITPY